MSEWSAIYFADTLSGINVQLRRAPGTDKHPSAEKGVVPQQVNLVLEETFNCTSFYSPVTTCTRYEVIVRRRT